MSGIEIKPVRGRRELKRFVKVPFHLHRDSDKWVPPLIFERMKFLDRAKNPFFEHAEAEYFIAERDGEECQCPLGGAAGRGRYGEESRGGERRGY